MQKHWSPVAMLLGLMVVLTTCKPAPHSTATLFSPPAPSDQPKPLEQIGPVTLVSTSLTKTESLVDAVFKVYNPNRNLTARYVPYTIMFKQNGIVVGGALTGIQVVDPNSARWVVYMGGRMPASAYQAEVKLYSDQARFDSVDPDNSMNLWQVGYTQFVVESPFIQGEVMSDLTWTGTVPQQILDAMVVVHQGGLDGPIVAAGMSSLNMLIVNPNQTIPVVMLLTGFQQPNGPGTAAELPGGVLTAEWSIDSEG